MIELGDTTCGVNYLAEAAHDAVLASGKAAIFLSTETGKAVAVPYTHRSFTSSIHYHPESPVGVYVDDPLENECEDEARVQAMLHNITQDIAEHVKLSRWWLAGKIARKSC